jgi:hypothetical protein
MNMVFENFGKINNFLFNCPSQFKILLNSYSPQLLLSSTPKLLLSSTKKSPPPACGERPSQKPILKYKIAFQDYPGGLVAGGVRIGDFGRRRNSCSGD